MLEAVERWDIAEITLSGPTDGNPFQDVRFSASFQTEDAPAITVNGFYDGDGRYCVRFSPDRVGEWKYTTTANRPELDGKTGTFHVIAPTAGNPGPVRVRNTFHFAYANGTPYRQFGTTCYVWTHQGDALEKQTLETLAASPFNKIRMCVFPKRYAYNENEPPFYPFAGTPPQGWDFTRFDPRYFHHLEQRIRDLQQRGIEADIILFHPYDRGHWGFDRMKPEQDDFYLSYVVRRLSAFRNVWWSLANEYDFMREKHESDWDRFIHIVAEEDAHKRLCSIHNGTLLYNHTNPLLTHASIQNGSATEDAGRAMLYRDVYRKPIVFDEVKYEGDLPQRWGNLTAEQMVRAFWEGTIAGTYVGHGETYRHPGDIIWWSKGGTLHGESPARIHFLREILETSPPDGIEPIDKWQNSRMGGQAGEYYLVYFGESAPTEWKFSLFREKLAEGMVFRADILDTWKMTITSVEGDFVLRRKNDYSFVDTNERSIPLPGRPWMALRLRRVSDAPSKAAAVSEADVPLEAV